MANKEPEKDDRRYPSNVADFPAKMVFTFHTHTGYATDQLKSGKFGYKSEIKSTITLPVTNNLAESMSLDWSAEFDQSYTSAVASWAAGYIGDKPKQEALMRTGTNFEKHSAMIFNGVSVNTYQFSWTMTPQSSTEASDIMRICRQFQYSALPSLAGGDMMFGAPDIVKLTILGFNHMKFLPMIITNVFVKYGSDVAFMVYTDGHVPEVQLTVQFSEVGSRNRSIQSDLLTGNINKSTPAQSKAKKHDKPPIKQSQIGNGRRR